MLGDEPKVLRVGYGAHIYKLSGGKSCACFDQTISAFVTHNLLLGITSTTL